MKTSRRSFLATTLSFTAAGCSGAAPSAGKAAKAEPGSARIDGVEMARRIKNGETTVEAVLEAAIARIEELQPKLNFLVNENFKGALEEARAHPPTGPLAGVPYLVKDLNDVTGLPTRQGSRITASLPPATDHDSYIQATLDSGVVVLGKSATPERGYSATTEPLAFGPTRNPWDLSLSSGGSSGGAAAAVASGAVPIAHANDGGGSIRMPSSCCGVVGLKPSRGRLQSDGPGSSPIDFATQGCVSISVRDTAVMTAATEARKLPDGMGRLGLVSAPLNRKLKIGLIELSDGGQKPAPEVQAGLDSAVSLLADMGHEIEATRWPMEEDFMAAFTTFWAAGAARTVRRARELIGAEPDETMLEPFTLGLAAHAEAQGMDGLGAAVERLKRDGEAYHVLAAQYDVLVSPVLSQTPAKLGYLSSELPYDTLVERFTNYMGYTPIHNISGAPAISVPLYWTPDGIPVGIQFSGPVGGEKLLLELAYALEEARPWAGRRPPIFAA